MRSIATTFNEERIPSPKEVYYNRVGKQNPVKENGLWNVTSIRVILQNEAYVGHMVQGKSGTISYKNHRLVNKPEEQWVRVENTHDPLITEEMWETARMLEDRHFMPRKNADGSQSVFVGLLRCADCGFTMKANTKKDTRKDGSIHKSVSFICGNYARSGKSACTVHTMSESVLTELILCAIRDHAQLVAYDEQRIVDLILQAKSRESIAYLNTYKTELKATEERLGQLDGIMQTLYEDKVRGVVPESMFQNLMPKYEQERIDKTETVKILRDKVERSERRWCDTDAWIKSIRKYAELEALTQEILLELVERIEISEHRMVGSVRECHINIIYRFVGDVGQMLGLQNTEVRYGQAI